MMSTFIANVIMKEADKDLEKGKAKYRAYFVNTPIYTKWKEDVDTILDTEGYAECIVTE